MSELAGGDVDRKQEVAVFVPTGGVAAGVFEHPLADRHDEPGMLGDVEEVAGLDVALGWMLPTQQHFGADRRAVFEAHERLIHQPQVTVD